MYKNGEECYYCDTMFYFIGALSIPVPELMGDCIIQHPNGAYVVVYENELDLMVS